MELLGLSDGNLTKLHQNFKNSEQYDEWLKTLEYDMLYGEKYAFGGKENYPYKTTEIKMGIKEITINNVQYDEEGILTITGENFTEFSKITLNEKKLNTVFIDNNTLVTENPTDIVAGDLLTVVQTTTSGEILSSTKLYLIGGTQEKPTVTVDTEKIIYKPKGFKLSTSIAMIVLGVAVISISVMVITLTLKRRKFNKTK
jgi:hypothetical protein